MYMHCVCVCVCVCVCSSSSRVSKVKWFSSPNATGKWEHTLTHNENDSYELNTKRALSYTHTHTLPQEAQALQPTIQPCSTHIHTHHERYL